MPSDFNKKNGKNAYIQNKFSWAQVYNYRTKNII